MQSVEMLRFQLNNLVHQAQQDIYTLSALNNNSPQILQRIWDTLSSIHFISELLANQASQVNVSPPMPHTPTNSIPIQSQLSPNTPLPNQTIPVQSQRNFTIEELAKYTGKNGMPAYVAVNGNVYDVTNNRAWAAATHFGLLAGKDFSQEFASCHAGQQSILATLPIVGRFIR